MRDVKKNKHAIEYENYLNSEELRNIEKDQQSKNRRECDLCEKTGFQESIGVNIENLLPKKETTKLRNTKPKKKTNLFLKKLLQVMPKKIAPAFRYNFSFYGLFEKDKHKNSIKPFQIKI